jgi:ATP-dependent helicase HrpB
MLPIDPILSDVVRSLATTPRLVLEAPPGAGKTTRVPRALLDAGTRGEIVVLEPRRLATRMAARRVADDLGEKVGETVGYQVRFEDVSSERTRIRFVTEGVLTRRLVAGGDLEGVGAVVLDEFHERHLQGDVALALVRRLARTSRPDLQIVVMSATLDAGPVAAFLDAPSIRAEGRSYPVDVEHLTAPDDRPVASQVASAVRRLVHEGLDGDVLVFLPGAAEIRKTIETCEKLASEHDLLLVPLHGDLSPADQDRAVRRADRRKIIVSTNVAESSVTIDGVVAVVDSGLARVASHAPWSGLSKLVVARVSRASAIQRAGRAGRTRPGRCLRLYTKGDFENRPEHDAPEILRVDLAQLTLDLGAANVGDIAWLDAPPARALDAARTLLGRLGAFDASGNVTELGRSMARFGVHPRQARIVLEGVKRGVADAACTAAALLAERDIRVAARTRVGGPRGATGAATERSDVVAMLDAFREARDSRFSQSSMRAAGLDPGATLAVERGRDALARIAKRERGGDEAYDDEAALLMCVLAGYPDRVARRVRARTLALGGGGSADLADSSAVRDAPWLVAVDAEEPRAGGRTLVRIASEIEPDWLLEMFDVRVSIEVSWDAQASRVAAVERMTYDGLVVDESPAKGDAARSEMARVLADAALARGARAFAPDGELDRWVARARFAASVDASVRAPSDDDVRAVLTELCDGAKSFAELREAGLLDLLRARFGPAAIVDRLAPERVTFTAGRAAAVDYEEGKPPWVESYLQDFFGMAATPRVGDGQVALVVHLWAPNKRAVQVTSDLAGFWQRHYPAIRKELMRKYPRHNWPEDPTKPAPRFAKEARK